MATEGDRRKAASLFIILAIFIVFSKVASAMDATPDNEVSSNVVKIQEKSTGVSINSLESILHSLSENETIFKRSEISSVDEFWKTDLVQNNIEVEGKDFFSELQVSEAAAEKVAEKEVAKQVSENNAEKFVYEKEIPKKVTDKQVLNSKVINDTKFVTEGERGEYFIFRDQIPHTEEDVLYLARGIHGEAGNQPLFEKYRCGNVMVNRMIDQTGRFPESSIKGILYSSGQFGCIHGSAFFQPTDEDMQVAENLLNGQFVFPEDIVWFNNTHDYGFLYCKPGYHCFSGYIDHGGQYASAKITVIVQKEQTEDAIAEEDATVDDEISETENTVEEPKEPEEPEVPESNI